MTPRPPFPHDRYAQLWARQLLKEFEEICWQHQVYLTAPGIEIFDAGHLLGEWRPAPRIIRISRRLILEHPWPVTVNVLKHEMAHQLAGGEAGHGPPFQEACRRLGVPPAYRTASGDTPALFADLESASQLVAEGRRFFAKVEKLLALARSANEHEAALAMRKANELIAKHNLQQTAADVDRHYRHVIISSGRQRLHGWQRSIAAILGEFFFVKVILAATYVPDQDTVHKTIELFGRAENVAVAEYCYHFLANELDFLWHRNKARFPGQTATEKNSYSLGVLAGFRRTLAARSAADLPSGQPSRARRGQLLLPATSSALVVAADSLLNDFIALRFPKLRQGRRTGVRINRSTYDHGSADGQRIVLNKGICGEDGNRGRLLPAEIAGP